MSFNEKLPKWDAAGTEPPEDKKVTGWQPGDHPPADYFNWLQHQTYLVTKELQERAAERADLDAHTAATGGHGATSAATPSRIMQRDASGRAKVAAPAADDDIARKDTVDSFVQPLQADLVNANPVALPLVYGQQIVTVPRDTPLNVTSIKGRTLTNLWGRSGNIESNSLSMWNTIGATRALDFTRAFAGDMSLKGSGSGSQSPWYLLSTSSVKSYTGKYYIFVASVFGTSIQAAALRAGSKFGAQVVGVNGQWFTPFLKISGSDFADGTSLSLDVAVYAAGGGGSANIDAIRVYEISAADYNAADTADSVAAKYPYVDDFKNVNGIYVRQIAAQPADDQYVFYPDANLAASVDGSVYDELYMDNTGQARVKRMFKTMDLTGDLSWLHNGNYTGYKEVRVDLSGGALDTGQVVKYDGRILTRKLVGVAPTVSDHQSLSASTLWLEIANTDSGWGDSYTPTTDEIKAYFYGWRMSGSGTNSSTLYTSGTKYWWLINLDGTVGGVTAALPIQQGIGGFKYRLQYQLAAQADEPIRSEGSILLTEGANTIEVGTGAVVRERVTVFDASGLPRVNYDSTSKLKYRTNKDIGIYRNSRVDKQWRKYYNSLLAYGAFVADIDYAKWDRSAVYEITYLALDTYQIGIAPSLVSAQYAPNAREVTDGLVKAAGQLGARVAILENGTAQAPQPQWIMPTLLNGTQNFSPDFQSIAYMKDALGYVHLRGMVSSGSPLGLFRLPPGYRPAKVSVYPAVSASTSSGTNPLPATINIQPTGIVQPAINTQSGFITLDGITFQAEQ